MVVVTIRRTICGDGMGARGVLVFFFLSLLSLWCLPRGFCTTESRYLRSDSWTVNGLTGYKFTAVQSSSGDLKADRKAGEWSASWVVTFYVCASGGSLTTLGSCTFSRSSDGSGYQTEYVSVALTAVSVTDAVQVGVKTWIGGRCIGRRIILVSSWGLVRLMRRLGRLF